MLRTLFFRSAQPAAIPEFDVTAALAAARAGELRLIDVREPAEFNAGHPAGATNLPISRLRGALDELPAGPIAFTCHSGTRSRKAAGIARAAGRGELSNVTGGYLAWQAAGLPTEGGS